MTMPIKRRLEKRRLDTINIAQKAHSMCGHYLIPNLPPFEDDEHRREAWFRYRDELMARMHPKKPHAWHDYEGGK
jgi:hypothetical protein